MKKIIIMIFRIILLAISAIGLIWFIWPIYHNVLNIGNTLGIVVCVLLIFITAFFGVIRKACIRSKGIRRFTIVFLTLMCVGAVWSAAMTVCMLSAGKSGEPPETATVLVLGSKASGLNPSADLWARINTAADYLKKNPKAQCIACGGKGKGEQASEASIIRDSLTKKGIDAGRIELDDKSFNTKENISNALDIIKEKGLSRKLAIVTDEYHEFRACSIAGRLGAESYAVPAATPPYILSSCWAREVLAITAFIIVK